MATWFATAAGNIDSAGRWNSLPNGTGTALTWPPNATDILILNNKNITVNVSTTVGEIKNDTTGGATAGGYASLTVGGIILTANNFIAGGGSSILRATNASGTVYIVGNIYAGTASNRTGLTKTSSGDVSITGNVYGGASSSNTHGIQCSASSGTVYVTGNIYGGQSAAGYGASINATTNLNVTGNVIANASYAVGCSSTAASTITVSGYAQGSLTKEAIKSYQGAVYVGEVRMPYNSFFGIDGPFLYLSETTASSNYYINGNTKTLSILNVASIVPEQHNTRKGVTYGDGAYTGTLDLGKRNTSMAGRF